MPCNSIDDCVFVEPDLVSKFGGINNIVYFGINLVMYSIYTFLFIFIIYNLVRAIYNIMLSPGEETMKKLKSGITNAVLGAVGILIILSVRFLMKAVFELIGIPEIDNVFINIPTP